MDLALNNLQRLICHKTQQTTNQHQNNIWEVSVSFSLIWFGNRVHRTPYLHFLCNYFLICFFLHTVLSNTNNFWIDLSDPQIGPYHVRPLRIWVVVGAKAMRGNSTLSKSPEFEPHLQMQFSAIPRTLIFREEGSYRYTREVWPCSNWAKQRKQQYSLWQH